MKKLLVSIAFALFSVQLFAQGFNGRPRPSTISSAEIALTIDSSGNRIPTAAAAYGAAKFAAANAANLVKSLTDAKIATTNNNLNAEQYARINQIAAQQTLITTLQNNATALQSLLTATQSQVTAQATQITNQGNLIGTQQTTLTNQNILLAKYRARMDSLSINPNDLITNPVMNQWVDTKIGGTYFAPTAISFGTVTATSIQPVLALVSGATSYTLWKNGNNIATLLPGNLTYTDANLTPGTAYTYSATATDGTHTSMPVTASTTTLAATADNSVASAGYTVIQYFDFSDLANKSVPANPNFHTNSNGNAIDGAIGFYSTDGNVLSIANGLLTVAPVPSIKIYYNQFLVNKTYKITLYNISSNVPRAIYIAGGAGVNPVQSGSNVTYTFQAAGSNSTDGFILPALDSNNNSLFFTMSAFKLEVQN